MKYLLTLCVVVLFSLPALTFADSLVPCSGPDCQACHLVQLGNNLLVWFIGFVSSIIFLVFVIGGLKMVMSAGNEGGVSEAKGMMTSAVIGFVILLAAWLIVDTVLKMFVDEGKLGVWNEIQCVAQPAKVATEDVGSEASTTPATAECTDDAALIAKYRGSPVGQVASGLQAMITCYLADPAVAAAVDNSQLYTTDRSHPRCSLTNGNNACGACSHSANSCHYGGGKGQGAMAVDFNAKSGVSETQLLRLLNLRKAECGGTVAGEGDHTHVSMPGCR